MKRKREVAETKEEKEARQRYRVLTSNAIFGEDVKVEEKHGEKYVLMTPTEAKKHTDADVRLQQV